ncbi:MULTISPECIES: hypothetical protein [Spirulina sp. CCY15215]|uniref:hypothetical protein n=1 Tax=Spirulina sp. CCY15215 TaxID=2767591 RepID=UPI00194FF5FD|nr:hypothetical protein [Spirulina major]
MSNDKSKESIVQDSAQAHSTLVTTQSSEKLEENSDSGGFPDVEPIPENELIIFECARSLFRIEGKSDKKEN